MAVLRSRTAAPLFMLLVLLLSCLAWARAPMAAATTSPASHNYVYDAVPRQSHPTPTPASDRAAGDVTAPPAVSAHSGVTSATATGVAADSAAIGASRVDQVLAEFGDQVVDTGRIVETPYGSTDIDVVLRDNTFIEVGGPAKSINLSKFGQQLQRVRWAADQAGGRALFRYAPGTPQSAIDLALKWFGPGGAGPIG